METILKVSKFAANVNNFAVNSKKTYRTFFLTISRLKFQLFSNVFPAIFGDEFYDLCSISRLMRTDWKVHKFASIVNEFASFLFSTGKYFFTS